MEVNAECKQHYFPYLELSAGVQYRETISYTPLLLHTNFLLRVARVLQNPTT